MRRHTKYSVSPSPGSCLNAQHPIKLPLQWKEHIFYNCLPVSSFPSLTLSRRGFWVMVQPPVFSDRWLTFMWKMVCVHFHHVLTSFIIIKEKKMWSHWSLSMEDSLTCNSKESISVMTAVRDVSVPASHDTMGWGVGMGVLEHLNVKKPWLNPFIIAGCRRYHQLALV